MNSDLVRLASRAVNFFRLIGRRSHHRRIRSAEKSLATLQTIRGTKTMPNGAVVSANQRAFGYLRKLHSAVFEEAILTSLQSAGYFVLRNQAYTGDGGLDGQFWYPGLGWVAIQAKRYSSHITASHVKDFGAMMEKRGFKAGLFVHSGRTGEGSREHARDSGAKKPGALGGIFEPVLGKRSGKPIVFVSGTGLLELLRSGKVPAIPSHSAAPARPAAGGAARSPARVAAAARADAASTPRRVAAS